MTRLPVILILFCSLLVSGTSLLAGQPPRTRQKTASPSSAKHLVDACALLTSAEIEAVLGEPVKETKPSAQPASGMKVSQCLFVTPTPAKSVSLSLTSPAPSSRNSVREFWKNQFHAAQTAEDEKDKEEELPADRRAGANSEAERESEERKPRFIPGLGDEAYWVGSPIIGALYVLQGDSFLRISVGGVPTESARIEKSKALARAAIHRLSLRRRGL